jgi:exodeoxyribonuclease V alpha subunit
VREPRGQRRRTCIEAAAEGDAARAIDALGAFRVLCGHRRGAYGVSSWVARIESWLAEAVEGFGYAAAGIPAARCW